MEQVKHLPVLKRFLFSFFFYNMGVQTVMLVAALYGKSELEIPTTNLIIAILIIQLIAIPGAFVFHDFQPKIGNLRTLMLLCCIMDWHLYLWIYYSQKEVYMQFYILAQHCWFCNGRYSITKPLHLFQTDAGNKRYCFLLQFL